MFKSRQQISIKLEVMQGPPRQDSFPGHLPRPYLRAVPDLQDVPWHISPPVDVRHKRDSPPVELAVRNWLRMITVGVAAFATILLLMGAMWVLVRSRPVKSLSPAPHRHAQALRHASPRSTLDRELRGQLADGR